MISRKMHNLISFLAFVLLFGLLAEPSKGQSNGGIQLDLMLQPRLTKAQVLGLSNLGINRTGDGTSLLNLVIRNSSNEPRTQLYLDIRINSNKVGTIANIYQVSGRPFSLEPGQVVVANDDQLKEGLPGVEERVVFNGGLTEQGEAFLNGLSGSTSLPPDIYTVTLSLYQGNNSLSGGELLETAEQTFGENLSEDTSIDLYLMQPGDVLGSNAKITSSLPVFRWDGPTNLGYRLIIVEANGQSPETLIESARGTESTLLEGSAGSGSLLDFEVVDARVSNITFPFPPSGVQDLESGNTYYWQVFTVQESVNATESIPSEIWEFTLAADATDAASANVSGQMLNALYALLGRDQVERLAEQGFSFDSITIEGQTYRGAAAVQKLQEMSMKAENGEITIVIE